MALIVVRNRVIICLLFLISVSPFANTAVATAQSSAVAPVLSSAVATSIPTAWITVAGNGFSAGGLVYIALYDQWGTDLEETRWTSASITVYGTNGSLDPAQGYSPGGSVAQLSCDQPLMVRAFDRQTDSWSNLLDVELACGG